MFYPIGLTLSLFGDNVLTILYPTTLDDGTPVTFDHDYYRDNHLTLIMDLYGDSIRRFELIQPQPTPEGAPPAQWAGIVNIYIADQEAFDVAGAEHTQALVDDVPNFTNAFPSVTAGTIYGIGES